MMGGDGSLTNCLRTFIQNKIPIDALKFVSLPFGSGNDTSRVFGWGATSDEKHLYFLSQICLDAVDRSLDDKLNIWDISVDSDDIWRVGTNN